VALLKIKNKTAKLDFDLILDEKTAENLTFELINEGWAGAYNYDNLLSVFSADVDKEALCYVFGEIPSLKPLKDKVSHIMTSELKYVSIHIEHETSHE